MQVGNVATFSISKGTITAESAESKRSPIRYLPLVIGLVWSLGTVFLFAFGPYRYHVSNATVLYLYLAIVHVSIWLGYLSGVKSGSRAYRGKWDPVRIVYIALFVSVVKLLFDYLVGIKTFGSLSTAIADPALARLLENERPADYVSILLAPLTVCAIPLAVYYWSRVSPLARIVVVLLVSEILVRSVLTATRNGILALSIMLAVPIVAARLRKQKTIRLFGFARKPILNAVVLIAIALFLIYSNHLTEYRAGNFLIRLYARTDASFNFEHPVARLAPDSLRPVLVEGIYYYTHGYSNLAYALDKPFIGTALGFGHSRFLTRNLVRISGDDSFLRLSYFFRLNIEDGVLLSKWITAYPWLASDVTFPGTFLVLFLFGRLLAQSWFDALRGENPFSIVMVTLLFYQFISLPQVIIMQDGPGLTSFYVILVLWLATRSRHPQSRYRSQI